MNYLSRFALLCLLSAGFSTGVFAQYVTIPDPVFQYSLMTQYPTCFNANWELDTTCSLIVNETVLNVQDQGIQSLEGLQYFDNLSSLILAPFQLNVQFFPTLPATLETFICDNNSLTSLPALPAGLVNLQCSGNQLTSLPPLPSTLNSLNCSYNRISTLGASLPLNLEHLLCSGNLLTALPPLPSSLKALDCANNQLTNIPTLPNSLESLSYAYNQIPVYAAGSYPDSLHTLYCGGNQISSLPTLPAKLRQLDCHNNNLTSIPSIPNELTYLNYGQNSISTWGTTYPDSLQSLTCSQNGIAALPALPGKLILLNCGSNPLSSLPVLPGTLNWLYANNCQLTGLPTLPPLLNTLSCSGNAIPVLPPLPASLTFLDCSYNLLSSLPPLPASLSSLSFDWNQLPTWPALPATLSYLTASGNPMGNLIAMPQYLGTFRATHAGMSQLPPLPPNLYELTVGNNPISILPALPVNLGILAYNYTLINSVPQGLPWNLSQLNISGNNISFVPRLPSGLTMLYCDHNSISYIANPLPANLGILICDNNPISCLPPLPTNLYTLSIGGTNITCIPNFTTFLDSNFWLPVCPTPCLSSGFSDITGITYADLNCDQVLDTTDAPIGSCGVANAAQELLAVSVASGDYWFALLPFQTETYFPATTPPGYQFSPVSRNISTNNVPADYPGNHFAFCPTATFDNLGVTISAINPPRPGFEAKYSICYENRGTLPVNSTLKFFFANGAGGPQTTPLLTDSATIVGDTLIWNLPNVPLFSSICKTISFQLSPATPLGMIFLPTATLWTDSTGNEIDSADNAFQFSQTVRGSYDPNDKQVYHQPYTLADVAAGVELFYTIRFQNTGTDTAFTVMVIDTLPTTLDARTIDMQGASASYAMTVREGHIVQWHFANILLVDSFTNEPMSHGFLSFKIRTKPQTEVQEIENRAAIYFDFNAPVITNTSSTNFLSVHPSRNQFQVAVFPNPATEAATLRIPDQHGFCDVVLTDVTGRTLLNLSHQRGDIPLTFKDFTPGTYILKVTGANGFAVEKISVQ